MGRGAAGGVEAAEVAGVTERALAAMVGLGAQWAEAVGVVAAVGVGSMVAVAGVNGLDWTGIEARRSHSPRLDDSPQA